MAGIRQDALGALTALVQPLELMLLHKGIGR
eukprot:CAMPEP_0115874568 /NCGR_PEP_ID=MMETSP0287-20121206/24611_1 /TAXON_ID=412157 /ORGANISM="Chrysochromulina rotalis, Strain UIO044" /LENGTH=30 /DNA_ID= /DNA_START= /DNA_END= /DNA_ORIENTATION=